MSTQLVRLPAVRQALGVKCNATVKTACARHGIEILVLNRRARAIRAADLERLVARVSRMETV